MSVDGRWEIILSTPMGERKGTLEFVTDGSTLTGSMDTDDGPVAITDGKVSGDTISWTSAITSPMKLTVKATATVEGDTLKGKAKAGIMPGISFTGTRIV